MASAATYTTHLVVPGQLIAASANRTNTGNNVEDATSNEDGFLRGHGTYVVSTGTEHRLYASTVGIVHRVNKLISVEPVSLKTFYRGQVGDLVVGRIVQVGNGRWKVDLGSTRQAILPLQGVHVPGGTQRIRTAADALDMRQYLREGELVSAEVHKVGQVASSGSTKSGSGGGGGGGGGDGSGSLRLHTRSVKYGKLENGCLVVVPPSLIPRRKSHYTDILNGSFQVLWGCNGMIWIQRNIASTLHSEENMNSTPPQQQQQQQNAQAQELVELQEKRRAEHANMPYSKLERQNLARLRNAIECLRIVQCLVTSEAVEEIYVTSEKKLKISASAMLLPENIIELTAFTRKR